MTVVQAVVDDQALYGPDGHFFPDHVAVQSDISDITDKNSPHQPGVVPVEHHLAVCALGRMPVNLQSGSRRVHRPH